MSHHGKHYKKGREKVILGKGLITALAIIIFFDLFSYIFINIFLFLFPSIIIGFNLNLTYIIVMIAVDIMIFFIIYEIFEREKRKMR